jgi:hypothetical protein
MKVSNFRSVSKLGGSPLAADERGLTQIRRKMSYGVNPKIETLGMNALPIKREGEWEIGDGIAGSSNSR